MQRAGQRGEPIILPSQHVALEPAAHVVPAFEQVEPSGDVAVSCQVPVLVGEENVAHPRELQTRLEVVALLRPVFAELHAAACEGPGPVAVDFDPIQIHVWTIEPEPRAQIGPHRLVVLNLHRAAVEHRLPVVVRQVPNREVQIGADDAPRCLVILVRKLAVRGVHILDGDREAPRALRLVVPREPRHVVPVLPFLDEHLPVGQFDRRDQELRTLPHRRRPVHRNRNTLRGEKRPVAPVQTVDDHVLEDVLAREQVNREAADPHRPLDISRPLLLQRAPRGRSKIDRQRRHDRDGDDRRDKHQAHAEKASAFSDAGSIEQLH